ncbi:hypothetical protein [Sulfitobacter sediminilitoris]|uniref:hypothetical protein n=1 Tax=Sulfitobacter sediminilitoris TaxID=2698830 RepID=UPI0036DD33AF
MKTLARALVSTMFAAAPLAATTCDIELVERSARILTSLEGGYGVQYWGESYTADGLAQAPTAC